MSISVLIGHADDLQRFVYYVCRRFHRDRCTQIAAILTYTSLLAMVPLFVVGLAMVASFPVFARLRTQLLEFVFSNFLPNSVSVLEGHLAGFASNAAGLGGVGVIGIAVTGVLLLADMESAFNQIWRVREQRRIGARLLNLWALMTLGPLLFGLSIWLSGYLLGTARSFAVAGWLGSWFSPALILPPLLALAGFTILYMALRKIGVSNRTQAAIWALNHGVQGSDAAPRVIERVSAE